MIVAHGLGIDDGSIAFFGLGRGAIDNVQIGILVDAIISGSITLLDTKLNSSTTSIEPWY